MVYKILSDLFLEDLEHEMNRAGDCDICFQSHFRLVCIKLNHTNKAKLGLLWTLVTEASFRTDRRASILIFLLICYEYGVLCGWRAV